MKRLTIELLEGTVEFAWPRTDLVTDEFRRIWVWLRWVGLEMVQSRVLKGLDWDFRLGSHNHKVLGWVSVKVGRVYVLACYRL